MRSGLNGEKWQDEVVEDVLTLVVDGVEWTKFRITVSRGRVRRERISCNS